MRRISIIYCLSLLLPATLLGQGFIENQGQWEEPFAYKADIPGGAVFLEQNALLFHFVDRSALRGVHDHLVKYEPGMREQHHAFRLRFLGCNKDVKISSTDAQEHYVNYFIGADPKRWKSGIFPKNTVIYHDLYDGVDLHVMRNGVRMKYEFHLDPGVDPKQIRIATEGLDDLSINPRGQLVMHTSIIDLAESKPLIYQVRGEKQYDLEGEFVISDKTVSYTIPYVDSTLPLVIDPELVFSTYSGSSIDNWGFTATPDLDGLLYSGSITFGTGYPVTTGAFDNSFNGASADSADVCITKYNVSGTALVFSTYLGGRGVEMPHSMIVDRQNNLYVFGTTGSNNFPTTTGAIDRGFNGGPPEDLPNFSINYPGGIDMYVTKFNETGSALLGSTYLGGSGSDGFNDNIPLTYNYADEFRGEINLDDDGFVYIASSTTSPNFPGTSGSFQATKNNGQDGIVSKLNSNLTSVVWSTYLGGGGSDAVYGIDIASDLSVYVTGGTSSNNFPVTAGVFQGSYGTGRCDGYISHISQNGKNLLHSTFYGTGSYDQMYLIQLDKEDHPHVFGQTEHSGSQLIFNAGFNDLGGGQVLAHFRPDLASRVWSTQFGSSQGRPNMSPTALLVDVCNSVYLSGWGGAVNTFGNNNASSVTGLPTTGNALQTSPDNSGSDFYLCVLTADANTLVYGSFYGGPQSDEHVDGGTSRFDRSGKIYQCVCAGCGGSSDFPIDPDPGAWSSTNNSDNCNSAVFKVDFELPVIEADFDAPDFGCAPFTATMINRSITQSATSFFWFVSNGQTTTNANPNFTFTNPGEYTIQLVVNDPNSCNLTDTLERSIIIKTDTSYVLPDLEACAGDAIQLGPDPANYNFDDFTVAWTPSSVLDDPTLLNPTATLNDTTILTMVIDYGGCIEQATQKVNVDRYPIQVSNDTIICSDFTPFQIMGTAFGVASIFEWSTSPKFNDILGTDSVLSVTELTQPLTRFFFRTTKPNGCREVDTVLVTISDLDLHLTNDTAICRADEVRIEALSENPKNTFAYYWSETPYAPPATQPELLTDTNNNFILINETQSKSYYLFANSLVVEGCTVQDSLFVQVAALDSTMVSATAEKDTFHYGERIQLQGTPSSGFDFYWTPGRWLDDSLSAAPKARAKWEITYTYVVSDSEVPECTYSDSVTIRPYEILCDEPEIFLPSAFSPNGDGINDQLTVRGRNISELDMAVYDRWGKLMFNTNTVGQGWDGNFKGSPSEPAVYVYYYEATCLDGQKAFKKGNVTLIR